MLSNYVLNLKIVMFTVIIFIIVILVINRQDGQTFSKLIKLVQR